VAPRAGLNAAEKKKTGYTDGRNLTVITRITEIQTQKLIYSAVSQQHISAYGPSSGWQEWKIKYTVLSGN
jgi:hypothetical protein